MSSYRDLAARFGDANAQVLGVSTDDLATQKKFAESLKLPFPLLVDDADHSVAKAYGVLMAERPFASRVTFVIDKDGLVRHVFSSQTDAVRHVDEAMRTITSVAREQSN